MATPAFDTRRHPESLGPMAPGQEGAGSCHRTPDQPATGKRAPGLADRRGRQTRPRCRRMARAQRPAQPAGQCPGPDSMRLQTALAVLDDEDDSAAALISRALAALQAQAHIEPAFAEHAQALESCARAGAGHRAQPAPVPAPHRSGPLQPGRAGRPPRRCGSRCRGAFAAPLKISAPAPCAVEDRARTDRPGPGPGGAARRRTRRPGRPSRPPSRP